MSHHIVVGISYIATGLLLALLSIPLLTGRVRINIWYGARFPKSFTSAENWYKINRHSAKGLILWSSFLIVTGVAAILVRFDEHDRVLFWVFSLIPFTVLIPAIESYLYSRKL